MSVTIAERHAADVSTATMTVCWDGSCKEPDIRLHTSTSPGPAQCDDGVCVSRASPTGDLNGFADVEDLPTKPVEVRLVLFDTNGSELMDDRVTVTPSMKRPNGDHCPPGGPNAGVSVEDGALRKPD
ncbi:hypothetical protein [Murinocardiopsis flavida]|uniref:hypothetical protein n=1 Tax=Murinocardiopsis flavida TaxID=645275 RepID=UPI001FE6CCD2|nr:hypothetical protein [Murinocardiopsis flavida]